jgi:hypothetical protein
MEYKGIRYTIRTCIVRQQWSIGVHPPDAATLEKIVKGTRLQAERQAFSMIDALRRQNSSSESASMTEV